MGTVSVWRANQALSLITAVVCVMSVSSSSHARASPSKGISINLRAKWPAPPTILEAYEFLVGRDAPMPWHCSGVAMPHLDIQRVRAMIFDLLLIHRRKRLQTGRQTILMHGHLEGLWPQSSAGMI